MKHVFRQHVQFQANQSHFRIKSFAQGPFWIQAILDPNQAPEHPLIFLEGSDRPLLVR